MILQRAEESISVGKGQVDAVLELRNAAKGVEGAAVGAQLRTREKKVVAAIEAQLQDAFERALEVRDAELRLQGEVALRVVSRKCVSESFGCKLIFRSCGDIWQSLPSAIDTAR